MTYREQIKRLADQGMPIYAECGGLMYMGQELVLDEQHYPMTGVLPISFRVLQTPPRAMATPSLASPSQTLSSKPVRRSKAMNFITRPSGFLEENPGAMAFEMERGNGLQNGLDGLCRNNVLATYTHIHALGTPQWAPALVAKARHFRQKRSNR